MAVCVAVLVLVLFAYGFAHLVDPQGQYLSLRDASCATALSVSFLVARALCTLHGTYRNIANDLNEHFRGHAQNLSFEADGRRLRVSYDTRA